MSPLASFLERAAAASSRDEALALVLEAWRIQPCAELAALMAALDVGEVVQALLMPASTGHWQLSARDARIATAMNRCWLVMVGLLAASCDSGSIGPDSGGGGGGTGVTGGGAGGGSGQDAGPVTCEPACDDTEVCEARQCVSRALAVRWLAPGDGARIDAGLTTLTAIIVPFTGREQRWPATLQASLAGSDGGTVPVTLERDDGGFSASVPIARGEWTASVSLGALTARQSFRAGPQSPTLRVDVSPIPDAGLSTNVVRFEDPQYPSSYRRSDHVTVRLRVEAGDFEADSFSAALIGDGQNTPLARVTCPTAMSCGNAGCACFDADLSVPTFEKFRGEFQVVVAVRDADGAIVRVDSSTGAPTLRVTRWAWGRRFFITSSGPDPAYGPYFAVGSNGRLVAGYAQGANAVMAAIDSTGNPLWSLARATMTSPVIAWWPDAGEVVHTPNLEQGIVTLDTATGAVIARGSPAEYTTVSLETSLVPAAVLDGGFDTLVGLTYPGDPWVHRLFTFNPAGWTTTSASSGDFWALTGNGADVIWGVSSSFGSARLYARTYQDQQWQPSRQLDTPTPAWRLVPTDAGVVQSSAYPRDPSWLSWSTHSNTLEWATDGGSVAPARGFVMPNGHELIGARFLSQTTSELVRQAVGASAPFIRVPMPAVNAAPALGVDGTVYVLTVSGQLYALHGNTLATKWQESFTTESFENYPMLDCGRDRAGAVVPGAPGRLVLTGRSGRAYSIIVDSRGLDTNASWPLEFHDPANTNNAQTDLTRWACP